VRRPHHHREGTDEFPTPPSSTSTPPTASAQIPTMVDDLPPRKRARYSAPINSAVEYAISDVEGANVDHDVRQENRPDRGAIDAKLPRIRIKMSAHAERRTSTRLAIKNDQNSIVGGEIEDDDQSTTPTQETLDLKEESWDDHEICETVDPGDNWRVVGLSNVGNTCFTNAILQVFSYLSLLRPKLMIRQTEILGEYFIQRYGYVPPPLTAINNPLTSADLTSRSSRSKTRRNQVMDQEIPSLSAKYFFLSFIALLIYLDLYAPHFRDYCVLYILQYPLQPIV
jgi:hypothetical protein